MRGPGSEIFPVVAHILPNRAATPVTNQATFFSSQGGRDTTLKATAVIQVQISADLLVTNSDSPDPVLAGSNLAYTIGVNNTGPSDASTVTLTDTLPSGTTFVSLAAPG